MSIYTALMFLLLPLITFREIFSRLFWYFYFITFIRYIHVRIVILSTLNRLYPQGKTFGLIVSKMFLEKFEEIPLLKISGNSQEIAMGD